MSKEKKELKPEFEDEKYGITMDDIRNESERLIKNAERMRVEGPELLSAPEIEQAVLGILISYPENLDLVSRYLPPEAFYLEKHREIYKAITAKTDLISLTEKMRTEGTLDEIGGAVYLTELCDKFTSTANIEYYAQILADKYIKRQMIVLGDKMRQDGYSAEDVADCISSQEKRYNDMLEVISVGEMKKFVDLGKDSFERYGRREKLSKDNKLLGISSGIRELDKITTGWQSSDLIILAGRPSMGKTALACHYAIASMKNVAFFSLEMSKETLADRMILFLSGIDAYRYKEGRLDDEEKKKVMNAIDEMSTLNIQINDTPSVNINYLRSVVRQMRKKKLCELVIIDYLQLISRPGKKSTNDEIGDITRMLKITAKENNIPIILLSQLNREVERENYKIPRMSNLRDSGAIEQDADIVQFVWRPMYYGIETHPKDIHETKNLLEIHVAKHRNGTTGNVKVWHNNSLTEFKDWERAENVNYYEKDEAF